MGIMKMMSLIPMNHEVNAENTCMKTFAFLLALFDSVAHLVLGPFELIVVVMFLISGGFLNFFMFLIFGLAAVTKLGAIVLAFYTTRSSTDSLLDRKWIYYYSFLGSVALNTISWGIVTYGCVVHITEPFFFLIHLYSINYVFLVMLAISSICYVTSKPAQYGFIPVYSNQNFVYSYTTCLLYTSPSPRDLSTSRMPSSA
eukprot:TRINITY_DN4769_c0_g1_i2.p1 TRINITY_DN4769_c0_g1~~TRINITY_DN4769_c0_g1_i2.p1  ORF type:complete len:200 (+),score=9.16 TRINITY_DN4769_c0_g1_i2:182-781(+)